MLKRPEGHRRVVIVRGVLEFDVKVGDVSFDQLVDAYEVHDFFFLLRLFNQTLGVHIPVVKKVV